MKRCAICDSVVALTERIVPTSDGLTVHVTCADREAARAWHRRCWAAGTQGVIGVIALVCVWVASRSLGAVSMLVPSVFALHAFLNRRWWQTISRWLRLRLRRAQWG